MAVADFETRIAELEISQRRAEMIANINAALSSATDEQGILSAVADLAEQNGVAGSALAYAKTDASGHVTGAKVVAMQLQGQPINIKETLPTDEFPLESNPILQIALENPDEPLFVENVFTDPRMEAGATREAFRYTGMTATVILWFRAAGRIQGVMTFNWLQEQPFNEEVRFAFKAIQPVAAAVIANRRLMLELEQLADEQAREANLFKSLVENSLDSIFITDLQQNEQLIYANRATHNIYGYDYAQQEMLGMCSSEMWPEEDVATVREELRPKLMQGGWSGEIRQRRKNEAIFTSSASSFVIYNDDGTPSKLCTILRDITERKQAEEALRQSETKFRRIIESLPIGIHIYENDAQNHLIFTGWNPTASRMIGADCSQFAGKTLEEAFPGLVETEIPQRYREVATTGQPWRTDQVMYDEGEIKGAFEVYAFQSVPGSAVIAFMDVTDRKRQQEEREALQQQVIEAQRQALAELSTPIIPIMDRIIVMPLVGGIDTGRSRDIMRSLLEGITRYQAKIAILDITGVPVVDSGVADHLNRTMQAARLKGAATIITGVSDAVAETIVDLGIDWSGFETLRDLQTGLVTALERVGVRLVENGNGKKRA